MAYTSEIDKLEARFRDNPKGRNFAPLADAYRKAGLIDNAIDLCQNGLKLHPDYVSAYIVYARCLVDKKDDPAAVAVFTKVLELDGENIIALRGLAELAERNGRYEEEVEWLSRLLNADPMNGDAAEALARAKGKAAKTTDTAPTQLMSKADVPIEHEDGELRHTALSASPSGPSTGAPLVEKVEDAISFNPGAHAAAKAEGLEVQQEVELSPKDIERVEVEGLARTQYEGSGMFRLDAPAPASHEHDEALPKVDLPLIMPEGPAPAGGPGGARAGARTNQTPAPPKPPVPPPLPPPASSRVPAAVALSDDDGAADTATLSRAEPVLTETMAELYLKQGHEQDALRVYQALLAQRPNDARLRSKVEQLSPGGKKRSGVSARGFLKNILSGRGGAASPAAPQSTLAAAFDVAGPGGATLGEPSHPAQDTISLDSVFGEEAARRAPAAGTSGTGAAGGTGRTGGTGAAQSASPGADAPKTGGFSFDEFFAGGKPAQAEPAGAPESKPGATSADAPARTPGRTSGRTQRPTEDEADADQFQQWLKKLKS